MEEQIQIEKSVFIRLFKSIHLISRLSYLSRKQDSQNGLDKVVLAQDRTPLSQDAFQGSMPVLVTAHEITNIKKMAGRDVQYWIFHSDNLPRVVDTDQLIVAMDFFIPEGNEALTFGFTFPYDATWLHFLLCSDWPLLVFSGPQVQWLKSLSLDLRHDRFRNVVKHWLASRSRQG